MRKAAFFDIDSTVYSGVAGVDFAKYLYNKELIEENSLIEMKETFRKLDLHEIDFLKAARNLIFIWAKYINGKEKSTVEQYARMFVNENKNKIYQPLLPVMDNHKKESYLLVAISASPIEVVSELEKLLNFDFTIATEVRTRNGIYTGEVVEPILIGKGRVDAIKKFAQQHSIDLSLSYAYGDSISDLDVLHIVGAPNVVNPSDDLRAIAKKNKWSIIES